MRSDTVPILSSDLDSTGMFPGSGNRRHSSCRKTGSREIERAHDRRFATYQGPAPGRGRPRTEHNPRTMAKLDALRRAGGASIRLIAGELGLSATIVARLVRDQAARPDDPGGHAPLLSRPVLLAKDLRLGAALGRVDGSFLPG
jgi:hypothetical protein